VALFLAGWPFWLTQLPVGLEYPNSRFALPFMLGASLLIAGLTHLIPGKEWLRSVVLALLVALGAGYHFQVANAYRRDTTVQKNLFWQMTWRAPSIKPNTALLCNDLPTHFSSDNSLTAPLNWIYASGMTGTEMPYVLYYTSIRMDHLDGLIPGSPIIQNYHAATFRGNTSQVLALYYEPPGCVRVLDPEIDPYNQTLPALQRQAAALSTPQEIIQSVPDEFSAKPMEKILGPEPSHGWCYYFERADLARQVGDWQSVVDLGNFAFASGDYPNDPVERFPFIEGYAHTGSWEEALFLSREAAGISPLVKPALCHLWWRIDREASDQGEKTEIVETALVEMECGDRP
jgi:hypothetical protein